MTVNLIPEDDLRAALRPHRVAADEFEATVLERMAEMEQEQSADPLERLSPLARAAAAMLPIQIFAGGKVKGAATELAPAGGVAKLLGYLAFPAICLFMLLSAAFFSFAKVR